MVLGPSGIGHHLGAKVGGADRGVGGLIPLVAGRTTRSRLGLSQRIDGQEPESNRERPAKHHLSEPSSGFTSHEIEMRCFPPDDGAEGDETAISSPGGQRIGGSHQLEGARHPADIDVGIGKAGLGAAGTGTFQEFGGHQLIVAADNDRDSPDTAESAGKFRHRSVGEEVAELVPLHTEVTPVLIVGIGLQRDPLADLEAVTFQAHELAGIVGHDPN